MVEAKLRHSQLPNEQPSAEEAGSGHRWYLSLAAGTICVLACVTVVVLRTANVVNWPWVAVLAPFTAGGALYCVLVGWNVTGPFIRALRGAGGAAVTPPPEQLGVPLSADTGDLRILAQHPELLAALCLGFRMLRLQPMVLGRSVTDPWGVYAAALLASPMELETLNLLARRHVQRSAATGAKALRRTPSDADVMKQALAQFRRCAAGLLKGRGNPDCPFEHVTVVFGTRSPNRDVHLKSIAPRVRALLERQYPQLATARLEDGSAVRYDDWQKSAVGERRELNRLRKEQRHQAERVAELERELAAAHAHLAELRDSMDIVRSQARAAALAEHERDARELRAALDVARHEHAREQHRFEAEHARLLATIDAVTADRDALERLVLDDPADDVETDLPAGVEVAGMRVLLVGGNPGHVPPIKEYVEAHGIQLVHEETGTAAQLVASMHLVVLWTRFMTHSTYFAVKRECRARNVNYCYWVRTSPPSLLATVAQHAGSGARGREFPTAAEPHE